jgi:hypothetical protein
MKNSASIVALALLLFAVAIAAYATQNSATGDRTLQNLQTAFNGESNAHARYLAFAVKADQEGYGGVASLFRAAARAEEIHAANHLVEIKKLGGSAQAKIDSPVVKGTKENLEAAVRGETYERDISIPISISRHALWETTMLSGPSIMRAMPKQNTPSCSCRHSITSKTCEARRPTMCAPCVD